MVERHRRRVWGLCYRMTGEVATSDDLTSEAMAKAIERGDDANERSFEGWLFRVATTTCLDWLRQRKREQRVFVLVDPIDLPDAPFLDALDPEATLVRRDDLRLAVLSTLQTLQPRQRAVLVLRDVLGHSTEEVAEILGVTVGNAKVLLHRARARLAEKPVVQGQDPTASAEVVERFARALEDRDLDALTRLLKDDVWGLIDDGAGRRRPTVGSGAVRRQWANAMRRYGHAGSIWRVRRNGEPALLVGDEPIASIHLETARGQVAAIRVILDPGRLARLAAWATKQAIRSVAVSR